LRRWGGLLLVFALLLRGSDEFGFGADFPGGILQGGEGDAIVYKSSKALFLIFNSHTKLTPRLGKYSCM
jgi:hypothetical protein